MAKSPREMMDAVLRNLPAKTGRSGDEWIAILEKEKGKLGGHKAQVEWLKAKHGLGHSTASIVAHLAEEGAEKYDDPATLVDAMYAGERAPLRAVYEKIAKLAGKLGKDVESTACKTYVAYRRKSQFAVVKPGKGRVDIGFALPGARAEGRLALAKGVGSEKITHVVRVATAKEVDGEVERLLREAYERQAR